MMVLKLIRKDIMIVKEILWQVFVIIIGFPLLVAWRQPQMGGLTGLLMSVLVSSVFFNLAVSGKESKYPKATALLSATPYMKSKLVFAKYALYVMIWLVCCIASFIEMRFVPEIAVDDFGRTAAMVFLIQSICMGIFLPVQYVFGYEKTKFVSFLLFITPFALTAMEDSEIAVNIGGFFGPTPVFLTMIIFTFGILAWFASFAVSEKVFNRKDLI